MAGRIEFDTGDIAASPVYDMGKWFVVVPDHKVREYIESLVTLGFSPEMTIVTDE